MYPKAQEDHPIAYEVGWYLPRILIAVCIVAPALMLPHDEFVVGAVVYLLFDSFDLIP